MASVECEQCIYYVALEDDDFPAEAREECPAHLYDGLCSYGGTGTWANHSCGAAEEADGGE